MKLFYKVMATVVVVGGLSTGILLNTHTTSASPDPVQEAKQAVQTYLDAVKSGNVDEMMKDTDDRRFKGNDQMKRKVYENLVKYDPLQLGEIENASEEDGTHVNVTLRGTTGNTGTHDVTLPVVKENGQWKLLIEGVRVTRNNSQK